jgi:UDP-N-acetyl-D-mannosaminuronate dehydrogenase
MPRYVIDRVIALLNDAEKPAKGSRVLLLGMTYKPNVSDLRESPSLRIAELLADRGAIVSFSDPYIETIDLSEGTLPRVDDPVAAAADSDLVVLLTAHGAFDLPAIVAAAPAVLDTRGVTEKGTTARL